jgi:hypothetical protein
MINKWSLLNAIDSSQWHPNSSSVWLLVYFVFNLALTIYNKLVLASSFPFPYTLTAVHCLFGTVGSSLCLERGVFTQVPLTKRESILVILFSGLYAINIIVSNVSLYVSIETELIVGILSLFLSIKSFGQRHHYSSLRFLSCSYQNHIHHKLIYL